MAAGAHQQVRRRQHQQHIAGTRKKQGMHQALQAEQKRREKSQQLADGPVVEASNGTGVGARLEEKQQRHQQGHQAVDENEDAQIGSGHWQHPRQFATRP